MSHPTRKQIGNMTVSVAEQGYPHWTRLEYEDGGITLGHEEARDLLYAMQRIVAFLGTKQEADRKKGFDWH